MAQTNIGSGQSGAGAILAALASMGKQNASTPAPIPVAAQDSRLMLNPQPVNQPTGLPIPSQPSSMSAYAMSLNAAATPANPNMQVTGMAGAFLPPSMMGLANQINSHAGFATQPVQSVPGAPDTLVLKAQLLQSLASGQVPPDQVGNVLAALGLSQFAPGAMGPPPVPTNNNDGQSRGRDSRYGANEPSGGYRGRSRSPVGERLRGASPPHRRDSPTYGNYDSSAGPSGNAGTYGLNDNERRANRGRGRMRNDYRQRSPLSPGRGRDQSPGSAAYGMKPKWIEYDADLLPNRIKGEDSLSFFSMHKLTDGM